MIRNKRIEAEDEVISPLELLERYPLSPVVEKMISQSRNIFSNILNGNDPRTAIMVGPCSIHCPLEAMEYAERLAELANQVQDTLFLVMRVYFEKPRTTVGWKGLVVDPHLDGSNDFGHGLEVARKLMVKISELGLPIVTEFLGPIVPQYIGDLVTTGTIGARTTESQTHREMASGLSMPIGFKNSTDGGITNALDAYVSARAPHSFLGINMDGRITIQRTTGNDEGYIILRGGSKMTNFDPASIASAVEAIKKRQLSCKLVVDSSHGNSLKKQENQRLAFLSVIDQIAQGRKEVAGLMLESNLNQGRQDFVAGGTLKKGLSITDECIGWDETVELIMNARLT